MSNKQNIKDGNTKLSIDKKDVVVVSVWGWPKRAFKRLTIQFRHHKIGIILGIILFVLIGSILILGIMYLQNTHRANKFKNVVPNNEVVPEVVVENQEQAQKQTIDISNTEANKILADIKLMPQPTNQAEKDQLALKYLELGSAYINAQQYDKATDAYNMVGSLSNTYKYGGLTGLALVYEKTDQSAKALEVYKQILALVKASDFVDKDQLTHRYEGIIKSLEQGGNTR